MTLVGMGGPMVVVVVVAVAVTMPPFPNSSSITTNCGAGCCQCGDAGGGGGEVGEVDMVPSRVDTTTGKYKYRQFRETTCPTSVDDAMRFVLLAERSHESTEDATKGF